MGRGNVCTTGPYEGLYYIDSDQYTVYCRHEDYVDEPDTRLAADLSYDELTGNEWLKDDFGTAEEMEDIERSFIDDFMRLFPSFSDRYGLPDKWVRNGPWGDFSRRVILENKLFYICIEDNHWSVAVELIQREAPWGFQDYAGLQKRHYEAYLDGIKRCLLKRLPSIGTYAGAWTSGIIKREEAEACGQIHSA